MAGIGCDECNCCALAGSAPCTDGCCKCPPTGDICFDLLDCQAYYLFENPVTMTNNWTPVDSCCTGMSFTLTHELGYALCTEQGHSPSTSDPGGNTCLTTGTGPGMPTGTGVDALPELWGFSGTVCGDCTSGPPRVGGASPTGGWGEGHWRQEDCDGMCLKASLCCCPSPFSGGEGFGPPGGAGGRCAQGASLPGRTGSCECGVTCYKFTMAPFDCYTFPNSLLCDPAVGGNCSPTFDSACSPCAFLEGPAVSAVYPDNLPPECPYTGCEWDCNTVATVTGANMGGWIVGECEPGIAKGMDGDTCGVYPYDEASACDATCPNSSGSKTFMALVEGVYESQCDCALGVMEFACIEPSSTIYPSGVGYMASVFVKFTALLSEC